MLVTITKEKAIEIGKTIEAIETVRAGGDDKENKSDKYLGNLI